MSKKWVAAALIGWLLQARAFAPVFVGYCMADVVSNDSVRRP